MSKALFLVSHDTETAIHIGKSSNGFPEVNKDKIEALNAFLTINHNKNIFPVWDDDDEFEEILDTYTFITVDDALKSIYNNEKF